MANIIDYLDWRGDISFAMSSFNDIDNLVLSAITYTPLDEICNSLADNESISLIRSAELYFKKNPIENIQEETRKQLETVFGETDFAGKKIAVTAGSRGISHSVEILRTILDFLKENISFL